MKIVGLTALARAGKDTTCQMLIEEFGKRGIIAKRYALADRLKSEMSEFFLSNFGVNILTVDGETKEILRPLLVAYGFAKRKLSKGTYWTSLLKKEMDLDTTSDVAIVTDIRYKEYDKDEVDWIKENGVLVHITRILEDGRELQPPNADEQRNDPIVKSHADYFFRFGKIVDNLEGLTDAKKQIAAFVDKIQ
jgi:hypothetical protein